MNRLVECVTNFSEGRRQEVIDRIAASISSTPGAQLLNVSSDKCHNRTVITYVGTPEGVEQAAFASIAKAAELIDMDEHHGEHPRVGATDVVPFIPIRGVTMEDCVEIARRVGRRVGDELGIPVYLYEAAATRPQCVNLADVRRGEYEGLKGCIATDDERAPDFGPRKVGKAGATVIGARPFLIAYNVYLNTGNVDIAKKIAKAIRHSGGGLRFVKALGLDVDGMAQVSMNLTDFTQTPVYRVQEMIRREAGRYGVGIAFAELVGLIPQKALVDTARWYLQLDMFEDDQVLETRLLEAQASDDTPAPFVEKVASGEPTPGGGAVAALVGALAAALAEMVAHLTVGREKYAGAEAEMKEVLEKAASLREELLGSVEEDVAAYNAVMEAYRLPKETPEEKLARQEAIQKSLLHAAEVPMGVARNCSKVVKLARKVAAHGNVNAASDAATAAHMAMAAFESAALNVRINATSMSPSYIEQVFNLIDELKWTREEALGINAEVQRTVEERAELPPM